MSMIKKKPLFLVDKRTGVILESVSADETVFKDAKGRQVVLIGYKRDKENDNFREATKFDLKLHRDKKRYYESQRKRKNL